MKYSYFDKIRASLKINLFFKIFRYILLVVVILWLLYSIFIAYIEIKIALFIHQEISSESSETTYYNNEPMYYEPAACSLRSHACSPTSHAEKGDIVSIAPMRLTTQGGAEVNFTMPDVIQTQIQASIDF